MKIFVPCDAKQTTLPGDVTTFTREYLSEKGEMMGFAYITISPNTYQSLEEAKMDVYNGHLSRTEELGLDSYLDITDVKQWRMHSDVKLFTHESLTLTENRNYSFNYFNQIIIGEKYTVKYELLCYDPKTKDFDSNLKNIRELPQKLEWLSKPYKDSKSGLSMLIPGGDWVAKPNAAEPAVDINPKYLWQGMFETVGAAMPEIRVNARDLYAKEGFEKALEKIRKGYAQNNGEVMEDKPFTSANVTKAHQWVVQYNQGAVKPYRDYIWLLLLPGNRYVEVKARFFNCEKFCFIRYEVFPSVLRLVSSLKY